MVNNEYIKLISCIGDINQFIKLIRKITKCITVL